MKQPAKQKNETKARPVKPHLTDRDRYTATVRAIMIIEEFIKLAPDMPVRQMRLFLLIALNPDRPMAEYARLIDLAPGGPSARHFAALRSVDETEGYGTKKLRHTGLGLIETYSDPNDKRNQLVRLSRRGEGVLNSIIHFIEEDQTLGQQYRVRE
ncbi:MULTISPECIES: hypothetical protein [unclassified Mesorhizobium]|uniref:hypothetical protein n=1 Tax=unclassified Mesorhizobium TaxID=325217 RepID=UPI0003CE9E9D|nr:MULTISPECIES: hypothetical protein [unclassified Mesorhizobium]ESX37765.1 hypothetical protein X763_12705 [Mesorhizobium sp. LSHC432A00]ESX43274.1 hypothetical protein X764_08015 [Mesorhizobium sp. LSHC440A00]WJI57396.1 hypothetical protein NLY33_01145 [Mesorhizobium sp. C432A]